MTSSALAAPWGRKARAVRRPSSSAGGDPKVMSEVRVRLRDDASAATAAAAWLSRTAAASAGWPLITQRSDSVVSCAADNWK